MQHQDPANCQALPREPALAPKRPPRRTRPAGPASRPKQPQLPQQPRLPRSVRGRLVLFLGLAALGATLSGACRSPSTRELAADGLATVRAYLPHQQTATLAVRSAPPGATIEIDGRWRGTTP